MKFRFLVLACLLSCVLAMAGQAGHPVPPGVREADKLPNPADIPPQATAKRQPVDPAGLRRHANELARLAQLIPPEVEQLKTGRLPKDLDEQLKRIEKLSKQLRREISH
jgi:hypothetical protein